MDAECHLMVFPGVAGDVGFCVSKGRECPRLYLGTTDLEEAH